MWLCCGKEQFKMPHNLEKYKHLFKQLSKGLPTWVIAIYVRLSKEDLKKIQRKRKQGISIDVGASDSIINQLKYIAMSINKHMDNYVIYDIYIDDGLTGTDFARSDYQRAQMDIDSKIVNCFMVKDITRFVRNAAEGILELDSYVLEKKIRFVAWSNPFVDTMENPHAITSPEVYQAFQNAEDVARITSVKVRDAFEVKRDTGEPCGGFPSYGFLKNPDPNNPHWIVDPVASAVLSDMYLWSAEGMSDRAIAIKLNESGIPNPTKYKQEVLKLDYKNSRKVNDGLWSPSTVRYLLNNKANIGAMVQNKSSSFDYKRHKQIQTPKKDYKITKNCHENAVDKELYDTVEKIRKSKARSTKTGSPHIFSNLVYCSGCNRAMSKNSAKNATYLVCRTYKNKGKQFCESKRTINFKVLEDVVLKSIQFQIDNVINLKKIVDSINQRPVIKNQSSRIEELLKHTKEQIEKTDHLLDSSYYDWKNNDISKEQYQRIRTETENKLNSLRNTIQSLAKEREQIQSGIRSSNEYFETFLKYENIQELDRLVLVELIEKIYIDEDKSIRICFNFHNQFLLIKDFIEENQKEKQKKLVK